MSTATTISQDMVRIDYSDAHCRIEVELPNGDVYEFSGIRRTPVAEDLRKPIETHIQPNTGKMCSYQAINSCNKCGWVKAARVPDTIATLDAWSAAHSRHDQGEMSRIADALKALGWEPRHTGYGHPVLGPWINEEVLPGSLLVWRDSNQRLLVLSKYADADTYITQVQVSGVYVHLDNDDMRRNCIFVSPPLGMAPEKT